MYPYIFIIRHNVAYSPGDSLLIFDNASECCLLSYTYGKGATHISLKVINIIYVTRASLTIVAKPRDSGWRRNIWRRDNLLDVCELTIWSGTVSLPEYASDHILRFSNNEWIVGASINECDSHFLDILPQLA